MGLGLLVGVAAVGVIAFRSVVERRQQIGVLRALGFQRSLVSLGFLIETAFVVGIGIDHRHGARGRARPQPADSETDAARRSRASWCRGC